MKSTIKSKFASLLLPACAALTLIAATTTVHAGFYMKIDNVEGSATDNDHKDWIVIDSMSSPITRALVTDPATGAQRRRGDVIMEDVTCTKFLDKASPKIAESVCMGQVYPEVEIHLCVSAPQADGTTKQQPYLIVKMQDVLISSYRMGGGGEGDPLPTEEVTLGYTEVEWTYLVLDKDTKEPTGEVVTGFCGGTGAAQ